MKFTPRYTQQIALRTFFKMLFVRKVEFPENFLFLNSGRGAIKWLLTQQKLILEKNLNVGLPCYACYTVYQSVKESDNSIILLDINPLSFSLTSTSYEQIKHLDILIWINYFGFKYTSILKEIRNNFPGLIIIEDCSQVDLRDYLKLSNKEICSDYTIFSFNFRKPITGGGGGLLILNENVNAEVTQYLHNSYSQLPYEKLSLNKIIHIIIYNFSYNYIIFLIFKGLITRRRGKAFIPEEMPIKCQFMNPVLKRIFYTQYLQGSDNKRSKNYTVNYFGESSELIDNYSFGSLSYYPVILVTEEAYHIDKSIDKFMLWENLIESYKFFSVDVSHENFPLTINFLTEAMFLPAKIFAKPDNSKYVFPLIPQ